MEARRRRGTARNGVVAGSVLESRMKNDDVKGGIKVFNGEESSEENGDKRLRPKQSPVGASGKRKASKSENSEGSERNPVHIARQRSEKNKNLDEQCKELSVSTDGAKKSPMQSKKTRSEVGKELSVSVDRIERNPPQIRKAKSESQKLVGESGDGIERNSIPLRKVKSESNKASSESVNVNERNPIPLTKAKSMSSKVLDEPEKNFDGLGDGNDSNSIESNAAKSEPNKAVDESTEGPDEAAEAIEKNPVGNEKTRSEETCKELDVCEEKVISSSLSNLGQVKSAPQLVVDNDDDGGDDEDEDWDEEMDEEVDEEIEIEIEKSLDVKEINIPEQKPKQVVSEEKKLHQVQERPLPISPIVKKQATPSVNHSRTHPIPTKTKSIPVLDGSQRIPETHTGYQRIPETHGHNKLQSLADLVMWKDASRSAFVFGIGTFIIISSSYTKDLNISLISVVSYLGLVYLAACFLFRSIICRGVIDVDETSQDYVVGYEEAVWLLEMILPYLNEFLLKLRALFSGDPATTVKMALLLFVLARCGSSITIWKMAKLGFFGAFTVPKLCSSYSTLLTAYVGVDGPQCT